MVKFHLDLVDLGQLTGSIESSDVVIDGNDVGSGERQAHRVVPQTDTQLENLLALRGGYET